MEQTRLYHLSYSGFRQSILSEGLKLSSCQYEDAGDGEQGAECNMSYQNKLFLYADRENPPMWYVQAYELDVWEVKVPDGVAVEKDPFASEHSKCFMVGSAIPPENIRLVETVPNTVYL